MLHHFLRHWDKEYDGFTGQELAQALYAKSQYLVSELFTEVKKPMIPQIDLYKICPVNVSCRTFFLVLFQKLKMLLLLYFSSIL